MSKKIVLQHGDVSKVAASMNCTREMVSKALNYKKNSLLARKIRFVAKEQYHGVEVNW